MKSRPCLRHRRLAALDMGYQRAARPLERHERRRRDRPSAVAEDPAGSLRLALPARLELALLDPQVARHGNTKMAAWTRRPSRPRSCPGCSRGSFRDGSDLPMSSVELDGWDNTTFRLGDEISCACPMAKRTRSRWTRSTAGCRPSPRSSHCRSATRRWGGRARVPRPWSIYRWLDGEPATFDRVDDSRGSPDLADFSPHCTRSIPRGPAGWTSQRAPWGSALLLRRREKRIPDAIELVADRFDAKSLSAYVWRAPLDTVQHVGSTLAGVGPW